MTSHEILLFALGAQFGCYLMLLIHFGGQIWDERRTRRSAEAPLPAVRVGLEKARADQ